MPSLKAGLSLIRNYVELTFHKQRGLEINALKSNVRPAA
jgi:hypothetical protein